MMIDLPDPLPEHTMQQILGALEDDSSARDEFLEGLSKRMHQLSVDPSVDAQRSLVRFVGQWLISCIAIIDPVWSSDIEDTRRAIDEGALDRPVSGEELRRLVTG